MTTIDAAAAWRVAKSVTVAVFAAGVAVGLGGCEAGSGLFASNAADPSTQIVPAQQGQAQQPQSRTAKIGIAPVIGAPDGVAKDLQTQLAAAIEGQRITVAKSANEPAEYTLRGYVVSAREKTRTKVSYIWDVTDQSGKRVNRITGEEAIVGPQSKDPWGSVSPQVVSTIAGKTAGSLMTWLPSQQNQAAIASNTAVTSAAPGTAPASPFAAGAPATPVAAPATTPAPAAVVAQGTTPPAQPAAYVPNAAQPIAAQPATAGPVTAMIQPVTGAPGDGSVALSGAIQRELTKGGVALTDKPSAQTYRVEGKVVVGQGQNGKQPIQIDWTVKDATGKKLGTVSQKNEVPQGSLDGQWGKTADAAASAAAQGILKLLPQTKVN